MKKIQIVLVIAMLFSATHLMAQKVEVDVKKSVLNWKGEKVTGEHIGTIQLKDGYLMMKDGNISGGLFHIDMTTIKNTDVEDADYSAKLDGHLKSDDFFGVENYPVATLEIKDASSFQGGSSKVMAHLTIKEKTHPVNFEVIRKDGKLLAKVIVDRAKYDVKYNSGSFFQDLGDKLIYDEFTLDVELVVVAK